MIVKDTFADYLGADAYGASDIKAFKSGSPAVVKWRRENRDAERDTDATIIGKAAHCRILTPDLFDASFVVKPEGMEFRSKEAKAQRDEWLASGKTILTADDYQQVEQIAAAFNEKPLARRSIAKASAIETSVYWTCAESGLPRKCRPDWWVDGEATYDLKISVDAEKDLATLAYKAHVNGWANQAAGCKAGLEANGVNVKVGRIVVIAPRPPQRFRVWLLEIRENDMLFLEMDNANTCRQMAVCHRSGVWPSTPDEWTTIELPASAAFTEADLEGAEEIPL